jgi:hypothetical protein
VSRGQHATAHPYKSQQKCELKPFSSQWQVAEVSEAMLDLSQSNAAYQLNTNKNALYARG